MSDLGKIGIGNKVSGNLSIFGTEPVLELLANTGDSTYTYTDVNATGTYKSLFELNNFPGDMNNLDTLNIQLRYVESGLNRNTWDSLKARIYRSGGNVALTNIVTVATNITNTTPANSAIISFTGLSTNTNNAIWNNAVLELSFGITKTKTGDTYQARVTAGELTGTYTQISNNISGTGISKVTSYSSLSANASSPPPSNNFIFATGTSKATARLKANTGNT